LVFADGGYDGRAGRLQSGGPLMTRRLIKTFQVQDQRDGRLVTLRGRLAWALIKLLGAGRKGCTPIDTPGPRWSGYVHKLRRLGIIVETIHENHGGAFPGRHARYVLRSTVTVVETASAEEAA
jgi:hypothetical protein